MTQEEMHELLVKTRNALAERGHTKGRLEDDHSGRVCLMGAFNLAASGQPYWLDTRLERGPSGLTTCEASCIEAEFIEALGFPTTLYAVDWNNEVERTEEEVLARLDEAIANTAPEPAVEFSLEDVVRIISEDLITTGGSNVD